MKSINIKDKTNELFALFTVGLFATICSKGLVLFPAYSLDDYLVSKQGGIAIEFYLSQGRYTLALAQWLITESKVSIGLSNWPFSILLLIALPAMVSYAISNTSGGQANFTSKAIGTVLICAHPYFTEYFTFRQAVFNILICIVLILAYLHFIFKIDDSESPISTRNRQSTALAAVFLFFATGSAQIAFPICLVFALFSWMTRSFACAYPGSSLSKCNRRGLLSPWLLPHIIAFFGYIAVFALTKTFSLAQHDPRTSVVPLSMWAERALQTLRLIGEIALQEDQLIPQSTKLALALCAIILFSSILRDRPRIACKFLLTLVILCAACVSSVAIPAAWWPVARSLSGFSFLAGASFSMLLAWSSFPGKRVVTATIASCSLLLIFYSNAMLSDQIRLNRWDINRAQLISFDVGRLYGQNSISEIELVSRIDPVYSKSLEKQWGDLNSSAFSKPWSQPGLFLEATGRAVSSPSGAGQIACRGQPRWPEQGAILDMGGRIFVCL